MPYLEMVSFPASAEFISDLSVFDPKGLDTAEGLKGAYIGKEHDSNIGYLVAVWNSLDDHTNFTKSPVAQELGGAFKKICTGAPQLIHVALGDRDYSVLDQPVLRFIEVKPKDPANVTSLTTLLESSTAKLSNQTWGEVVEQPGEFRIVLGWNSVEERLKATEDRDARLGELAALQVVDLHLYKRA